MTTTSHHHRRSSDWFALFLKNYLKSGKAGKFVQPSKKEQKKKAIMIYGYYIFQEKYFRCVGMHLDYILFWQFYENKPIRWSFTINHGNMKCTNKLVSSQKKFTEENATILLDKSFCRHQAN